MISWDSVLGGGNVESFGSGESLGRLLFIGVVGFAVFIFGALVAIRQQAEQPLHYAAEGSDLSLLPPVVDDEPLEATLLDDVSDSTSS
jgi:hypothetical protein